MPLLRDYFGQIVVLVLSLMLAVATDRWFPSEDRKVKRFWSWILFILSVVLGYSINAAVTTGNKVEKLTGELTMHVQESESESTIHKTVHDYEGIMMQANGTLRTWGKDSLRGLEDSLGQGYIPITREAAPIEIAQAYTDAGSSIIASNVGSIDFYFDNDAYKRANQGARDRHVPVVRFFLFSDRTDREIKLTKDCSDRGLNSRKIADFSTCVSEVSKALGTLCSIVINYDQTHAIVGDAKDVLIIDGSFVAQTQLDKEDWHLIEAQATEDPDQVRVARNYFSTLRGVTGNACVEGGMDAREIANYFPQYKGLKPKPNQTLAQAAFDDMLDQSTRPR
jgi:hypothetical protein